MAASEKNLDANVSGINRRVSSSTLIYRASYRDCKEDVIGDLKRDDSSGWENFKFSPFPRESSTFQLDSNPFLCVPPSSSSQYVDLGEFLEELGVFDALQNLVSELVQKFVLTTKKDGSLLFDIKFGSSNDSAKSEEEFNILDIAGSEFELGGRVNTTPTPSNDGAQTSTGVCPVRKLSINGSKESTVDKKKYVLILEKLSSDIVGERLKTDNLEAEPTQDPELIESLKAAPQDSTEPPADRQTDREADTSDHDVKQTKQHQVEYSQEKRSHELQAKEDKGKEKNRKLKESDISTQEPSTPGVSETTRIIADAFANLCRRTKKQVELDQKLGFCLLPFKSRISRRALLAESLEPRLSLNEQPVNPHRQGCVASLPEWACSSQPDYLEHAEHGGCRSRNSFPVETARACSAAHRGSRLHATSTKVDRKSAP